MDNLGQALALAIPFVWLGMILAISFLETPLKFRAPGITLPLGLGIGRIVFRAMNFAELGLAVLLVVACAITPPVERGWVLLALVWLVLVIHVGLVRPRLDRRTLQIIAGHPQPPSRQHLVYVALEVIKVALLVALGTTMIASVLP